ncbi:hypothetical protein AMECASPLE_039298 [Ameca splendens]|uniref:Uncharacterized protein n=1 Tax=Ameca splendens TaxID=208324 RepID=A0ABV1A479_9TELE
MDSARAENATGESNQSEQQITAEESNRLSTSRKRYWQVRQSGIATYKLINGLSTSRKRYRRAEQTYQKPWKKRQLAQPLEGRIIRSSDRKRSRGSQQQAARGTNKHKSTPAFINMRTRRKKGLGSRCHVTI